MGKGPSELPELAAAADPRAPRLASAHLSVFTVAPRGLSGCVQEQPFEEFLFSGQDPTPAAHVASYIAYNEADRDVTPAERQVRPGRGVEVEPRHTSPRHTIAMGADAG